MLLVTNLYSVIGLLAYGESERGAVFTTLKLLHATIPNRQETLIDILL